MPQTAERTSRPPNVRILEIVFSIVTARALWAAAEAGVADHLDGTPLPVADLASATGSHADALYRVLRLLATHGIFEEHDGRRFSHTAMSRTLRTDHPTRARAAVLRLSA